MRALSSSCLCLAICAAGCGSLATPDYRGEEIGHLRGTITSELARTPPPSEMVLLWINWKSAPGTVVGTRSPVRGTFPAGFRLSLHVPPPSEGLNGIPRAVATIEEPHLGVAWIVVLREGAAPPGDETITHADVKGLHEGDVLGWCEDFVLAYLDEAPAAETHASRILPGVASRGFHLMRAQGKTPADLELIRQCREMGGTSETCAPAIEGLSIAESGMDTEIPIRLRDNLGDLRVPVFALPRAVEVAFGITDG